MEDDYFIGRPLKKSDFFYYDKKEKKVFPYVVTNLFEELDKKSRMNYYYNLYKIRKTIKAHGNKGWTFSILSTDKYFIERYNISLDYSFLIIIFWEENIKFNKNRYLFQNINAIESI